jgi:hypothetical protein
MKKFIITEDDKKHIIGLYESAPKTTDFIKQTNNKEILQLSRKIINSEIKQSAAQSFILDVKELLNNVVSEYVTKLNGYSPNILQQLNSGKGVETANLYLKVLTPILSKRVSELSSTVKFAIRKMYDKEQLKKKINEQRNKIEALYSSLLTGTLMWLHDMSKKNEVMWFDGAYDTLENRKDSYINQMIDIIVNSIYK